MNTYPGKSLEFKNKTFRRKPGMVKKYKCIVKSMCSTVSVKQWTDKTHLQTMSFNLFIFTPVILLIHDSTLKKNLSLQLLCLGFRTPKKIISAALSDLLSSF